MKIFKTKVMLIAGIALLTVFIGCGKHNVGGNHKFRTYDKTRRGYPSSASRLYSLKQAKRFHGGGYLRYDRERMPNHNTEEYNRIYDNNYKLVKNAPLSTMSIDVDTASYSNVRRFINSSRVPPKDAVRIEEMINYFTYSYPGPKSKHPFSINTELSDCPWNKQSKLLHIGLQGRKVSFANVPANNLVFLIDVSGSMQSYNKLHLLKKAFKVLVKQLRPMDRIAMVVYAGAAGLVLESTPGDNKQKIMLAINRLTAGGSTAGGAGIKLAYKIAKKHFIRGGNNRIILASDGDFNVGVSSTSELVRLVEKERKHGVFLTVLGFGMGNYKDSRMEQLADKGNGNYAYIDNILEAKKVLGTEMVGTLFTIAKDVKVQIEFNPAKVKAYRLIGYVNRKLKNEDFNNDKKDAGELGAGHSVTVLYEIVPVGSKLKIDSSIPLKYQTKRTSDYAEKSDEMATVKFRYKKPKATKSILLVKPIKNIYADREQTSDNFRFSAAVAQFGMLLRKSKYKGTATYDSVIALAKKSTGEDKFGYRAEFIRLVKLAKQLSD